MAWFNDHAITERLIVGLFPVNIGAETEWFDKLHARLDDIVLAIHKKNGDHIGNTGLHLKDRYARVAEQGTVIGKKTEWRQGYATEAKIMIMNYGFKRLGLNRIYVQVFADNIASLRANEKVGLKKEGVLRQHIYKNGIYNDVVIMSALKEEWLH